VTIWEVVRSSLPFILIELAVLALLILLPEVAVYLPTLVD